MLYVYTDSMAQLDIYIRNEDKIKLMRKAQKMNISISKLMVRAALEYQSCKEEKMQDDPIL